jgi:hypothetical protein
MLKRKFGPIFKELYIELFTQKIVIKRSKIWVWDPGSEIRKKPILDPGVKKAPDPGSGSATLQFMQVNLSQGLPLESVLRLPHSIQFSVSSGYHDTDD